ncbi:MAG TPA: hypothetical protein VIQ24_19555 [Pyrinomonadaceae bacterium]
MSFGQFFIKPSTALLALVIFAGSTVLLGRFNPKNPIIERLGDRYFSTDQTWCWRPQDLFDMLDMYSPDGKEIRAHIRFIYLDLVYPLIYSVTVAILLAALLPALLPATQTWLRYLAFLPVVIAVFDYLENLSLLWILQRYSATYRPFGLARFSSAMTTVKLFLMWATAALLIACLVALVVKLFRNSPAATRP